MAFVFSTVARGVPEQTVPDGGLYQGHTVGATVGTAVGQYMYVHTTVLLDSPGARITDSYKIHDPEKPFDVPAESYTNPPQDP